MSWSYFLVCQVICVLQIYSGFILIKSVLDIRRFFVEQKAMDYLNNDRLLKHAVCFGLYIVTTAVYFIVLGIWTLNPTAQGYQYVAATGIFFQIGSGISQILLCQIIWVLGKKVLGKAPDDHVRTSEGIIVEEFDEDAQLQAEMWNSLVREDEKVQSAYIVSAQSYRVWHSQSTISGRPSYSDVPVNRLGQSSNYGVGRNLLLNA